jgi:spoIIIJ-associated protein
MYINSAEDFDENLKIIVDIDGYKTKRVEKLLQMAAETADQVKSSGKEIVMPSMSSYERFIIHDYVSANYPDLSTSSIGEEPDRKIIVSPIPSE